MAVQTIDLSILTPGDGFIVQGDLASDTAGNSVSNAGDVNGDGIDDFIIGARSVNGTQTDTGAAYVIFGRAGATRPNIDLSTLAATDGFSIRGNGNFDYAGVSVSAAGDINGDGIDDLIFGASGGGGPGGFANPGRAYVIFGQAGATRANINLASLASSDGFTITGGAESDRAGYSVSDAGDVNGDGIDDFIVGVFGLDTGGYGAGGAYVIYGKTGATRASINLASLPASDGFLIQGDAAGDQAGRSVSAAGDVNGDGIDDLIVGARFGDDGGSDAGEAYVIFGQAGATRATVDLTGLSGTDGFVIIGDAANDLAGRFVANAGDVNGDGIDDLLVSSPYGDDGGSNAGEVYVIFGKSGTTRTNIDLTNLAATDGFIIQGDAAGDQLSAAAAAGDVNGDGIGDIIVGASLSDTGGINAGAAYVIFGRSGATRPNIDLTNLTTTDGLIIQGDVAGDVAGASVSGAGDINGDGIDDLLIGAPYGDNGGSSAGEAYIIFGRRSFSPIVGTTGDDVLNGTGGADVINADAGNDRLNGGAGIDELNGGAGDDIIDGGADADTLRGGTGNDVYIVGLDDVVIEAANEGIDRVEVEIDDYALGDNIENYEYTGEGEANATGNALANIMVGAGMNDALNGGDGDDTLAGEAGDDVLNGGNGNDRLIGGTGIDTMNGGAGNDTLVLDQGNTQGGGPFDIVTGGDGIDTLVIDTGSEIVGIGLLLPYILAADIEIVQVVSAQNVGIRLNALDNLMGGGANSDGVDGGAGNDTLYGRGGDDGLFGGDGIDRLFGEAGSDNIDGGAGNDLLYGGTDADRMHGAAGNDTIYGEAGDDVLLGDAGTDQLFGGLGADIFEFTSVADSSTSASTADRIRDFSQAQGDRIDLRQIDADGALGGNDAFSFIGTAAFGNVAGQLRAVVTSGNTFIQGDVNGDGVADFVIRVDGVHTLTAADFLL